MRPSLETTIRRRKAINKKKEEIVKFERRFTNEQLLV